MADTMKRARMVLVRAYACLRRNRWVSVKAHFRPLSYTGDPRQFILPL